MPEASSKNQDSIIHSRDFNFLLYVLGTLLLFTLIATIIMLTGGVAALPLIGAWFISLQPILVSTLLAAGFITVLAQFIILSIAYTIKRIKSALTPTLVVMEATELQKLAQSVTLIDADKQGKPSPLSDEDATAIVKLREHLNVNLEPFITVLLEKYLTHKALLEALILRASVKHPSKESAEDIFLNQPPAGLDIIFKELEARYADLFKQFELEHGTLKNVPNKSQNPDITKSYTDGYYIHDLARVMSVSDKKLTDMPIRERLLSDAIEFQINALITDIVYFRLPLKQLDENELVKIQRQINDCAKKVHDMVEKKMLAGNLPFGQLPVADKVEPPEDRAHYGQCLASREAEQSNDFEKPPGASSGP